MRRLALITVVAFVIGVLIWLSTRASHERLQQLVTTVPVDGQRQSELARALEAPVHSSAGRNPAAPPPDTDSEPTAVDPANSETGFLPPDTMRLEGRVIVVDAGGVEHTAEDGAFKLVLWNRSRGTLVDVSVIAGAWHADVEPAERLSTEFATLGGRRAYPAEPQDQVPFPENGRFDLRFRWPSPLIVHARDARSGVDLSRIQVLMTDDWIGDGLSIPTTVDGPGVRSFVGASPLTIDTAAGDGISLFVRAPRHAWVHLPYDREVGGDVFAELTPACTVVVDIAGPVSRVPVFMRIMKQGSPRPVFERRIDKTPAITVEGLPAGAYTVCAQVGNWFEAPITCASADIELMPNVTQQVDLTLERLPEVEFGSARGRVLIPKAWEARHPWLFVNFRGTAFTDEQSHPRVPLELDGSVSESDAWAWQLSDVRIGRYTFELNDPQFVFEVDVASNVVAELKSEVPLPVDVSVRVLDTFTNTTVRVADVMWHPKESSSSQSAHYNSATDTYDFRCPEGEIEISTSDLSQGILNDELTTTVRAGQSVLTLPVTRATCVRVYVKEGEQLLSVDAPDFEVSAVDGAGRAAGWTQSRFVVLIPVTAPGRYRVELRTPLVGYGLPAAQIVEVKQGAMTDVVFRLARKP